MANFRQIKYTSRDFESLRSDLIDYTKMYFKDSYGDFTPTSVGMMMMELVAYVGDVLSYYQDMQYADIFNPSDLKSAVRFLRFVGGKYSGKTQSNLVAKLYCLVPSKIVDGEVQPDEDFLPIVKKGLVATTQDNKQFISVDNCDFTDEVDREISIYSVDETTGTPTMFAVRKPVRMVSGMMGKYEYQVGDPSSFLKISLPSNQNILEIISVEDSIGDRWYEVEYLAQDEVFISEQNINNISKNAVPLVLKKIKVPKRFISETDHNNVTSLIFGSSKGNLSSGVVFPNMSRFYINNLSDTLGFFSFNSGTLLNSGSMGLSPANTKLTINYLYGGGSDFNILSKELDTILEKNVTFSVPLNTNDSEVMGKANGVINSVTIMNDEQAKDGIDSFSLSDLKQMIPIFYASQKRAVTLDDYLAILYSMPNKYGGIHRAIAIQDNDENNSVALYLLTKDKYNNLAIPSDELKENVKTFLGKYRMITENVNIYDGEIVNYKLKYSVVLDDGVNESEALEKVNVAIWNYIQSNPFTFGESILMSKILKVIDDVDGVISITDLKLENAIGENYAMANFSFDGANMGNMIAPKFNQIFELKYKTDISGSVKKF